MFNYKNLLNKINDRTAKIAIWGCGFVGTTNIFYLIKENFNCLGIDIDPVRVNDILNGSFNINSDMDVIGKLIREHLSKIDVTADYTQRNLDDYDIHLLCLPTEKAFRPCSDYVADVVTKIAKSGAKDFLLIIECSMPPRWIDESILSILASNGYKEHFDYILGAAPRRDLFGEIDFSLRKTKRVIGADSEAAQEVMSAFYGTFCENLVIAKDCYHTVLSKIVENTYRCFDISLANQLTITLSDFDMTHVLELASTKWNVEKYHPSFGIGGYCIPLAPQYIKEQMNLAHKESKAFNEVLDFIDNSVEQVVGIYKVLLRKSDKILVMGLSSIPNVSIMNCSIGMRVAIELAKEYNVVVSDPYVNKEHLEKETGLIAIEDSLDLTDYNAIFVISQHNIYGENLPKLSFNKECIIVDSFGIWNKLSCRKDLKYFEIGRPVVTTSSEYNVNKKVS